jgi:hypothetical protein
MAINSYFYDSVAGNTRTYSAADFAKAFDIILDTGVILNPDNTTGFDIGGTNYTTIYAGKAFIQGRFVEVTGVETLVYPAGSYSGQIVIKVDFEDTRAATLVVKTDQTPIQSAAVWEYPLYNVTVSNGVIVGIPADLRTIGGATGATKVGHTHAIADILNLQSSLDAKADDSNTVTWALDPNGIKATMGKFNGTGKPVVLFLTTAQPAAVSTEHRVWIQIDNF